MIKLHNFSKNNSEWGGGTKRDQLVIEYEMIRNDDFNRNKHKNMYLTSTISSTNIKTLSHQEYPDREGAPRHVHFHATDWCVVGGDDGRGVANELLPIPASKTYVNSFCGRHTTGHPTPNIGWSFHMLPLRQDKNKTPYKVYIIGRKKMNQKAEWGEGGDILHRATIYDENGILAVKCWHGEGW